MKNPLNEIEKYKIFDNIRRIFINPSLLLLMFLSFIIGNPIYTTIAVLLIISLPIFFYLNEIFNIQKITFYEL